jgi:hypothetical protein
LTYSAVAAVSTTVMSYEIMRAVRVCEIDLLKEKMLGQ